MYEPIFNEPRSAGLLMMKQFLVEYLTSTHAGRVEKLLKNNKKA